MVDIKNSSSKIFAEQVRLLYVNSTIPIFVSVAVGAILCWSLLGVADKTSIINWFSIFLVISTGRIFLLYLFYKCKPGTKNIAHWHIGFLIGAYCVAAVWGAAPFFLFPYQNHQAQIIFLLAVIGLSAGTIASLCPSLTVACGYLSLTLLPLTSSMILHGTDDSVLVGLLILLFLAVILSGVIRINRNIRENIQLRFQGIEREIKLKASQDRYKHIFNNAPLGIFHYDTGSTIISCNSAFSDIIGSSKEKLVGFDMLANIKQRGVVNAIKASLSKGDGFFQGY
jgi:PAS domain-containing protein